MSWVGQVTAECGRLDGSAGEGIGSEQRVARAEDVGQAEKVVCTGRSGEVCRGEDVT
jgi:hypothetical protein